MDGRLSTGIISETLELSFAGHGGGELLELLDGEALEEVLSGEDAIGEAPPRFTQLLPTIIVSLADSFGGDNGLQYGTCRAVALWSFFAPEQAKTIRLVRALFLLLAPLSRIQMPGS